MTLAISLTRIHSTPTCHLADPALVPPDAVASRAQAIWDEELQRRSADLFNGEIVSVTSLNNTAIVGRRAEYRSLLAQSRDPDIFRWLQVRPLAVTGILICPEGVVIGRRSKSVFQSPGLWELAPSGSVDLGTMDEQGNINLLNQLMQELKEEIGLSATDIAEVEPLAIACDTDSQVFDVCFILRTSRPWPQILASYAADGNSEYESLDILPLRDIVAFAQSQMGEITPLTISLLKLLENEAKLATLAAPPAGAPAGATPQPRKLHTAIIVQARTRSTRLPGKAMQMLAGKRVLEHVVERLQKVRRADEVVIATTSDPADDCIAELSAALGLRVYRGDESDVMFRYLGAARMVRADIILRVTSDCPLIDPELCDAVLELRERNAADFAANNFPRLFPHGLDCEAFTIEALEESAREATLALDREHVTPWMRRDAGLRRVGLMGPGWPANQQRWTLDYAEDMTFFNDVFARFAPGSLPGWQEVVTTIGAHGKQGLVNAHRRLPLGLASREAAATVVFHFEANARIGTGHAMRCNALQSRLEPMGWRCLWAIDAATEEFLGSAVPRNSLIRLSSADPCTIAKDIAAAIGSCGIFVIDHYGAGAELGREMRTVADQIVWFDDLADRPLDADVIINPNPGFSEAEYGGLNARPAKVLLGADFALLRQQFSVHRANAYRRLAEEIAGPVRRIVVAFGGVDPLNGTAVALQVLAEFPEIEVDAVLGSAAPHLADVRRQAAELGPRCRVITDVADMAGLLAGADIVIGAPGTSTWERACLGLPSLLIGIAENQRANAAFVASAGAGLVAGFLTDEAPDQVGARLKEQLHEVVAWPRRRQRMARAAFAVCDGRGCQRIIAALLPPYRTASGDMTIRIVEARDEALLLDWQRNPETRRFALNPAVPSSQEHHVWLQDRLLSSIDWFLMAERAGEPLAFVRIDWIGEDSGRPEFVVSIATSPWHHRQGLGAGLLHAIRQLSPSAHFLAKILPENVASLALFIRAGYTLGADGYFHARPD
ncbi:UDP-2,4-diacetamido-2,4,6-trideoxy-beta-L-altropyranose hydrolase [Dongia mobilis]|uniref:UDP-2,4-diacetamido-2,4, 6-trideoxy-beta-L-altropyranose hydrolase n=1 Tax=Dongia mobilis TaxID=578943 RepID=A0A4R6WKL8_9PROT|nr:UDP-2,4-diacetamido-2,4,6-trideoxy-beta-L-altropyranose hydrolase [Dongia mobilis]TDQ80967.1 UDP-2,4-diacetamido-2,4,6-trideoxy-beta-L-altropyranose hydrolase [Dongia mobilis]